MPRIFRCKHRKSFDRRVCRRREIERHAIYVGAADTDDFDRWLIAWSWHNANSKDPIGALIAAAQRMDREGWRMGRKGLTAADAEAILEEESISRRYMSADNLARFLGVSYPQRQALGLTTIGAIDVGKRARLELRKRKDRLAKERKRRAAGARPQAQSLSRTEPWKAEGISRASWYRRRRETVSSTADSFSTADEVVSLATSQASGRPRGTVAAATVAPDVTAVTGGRSAPAPAVDEPALLANRDALLRLGARGGERRAAA
jgi:hypothetical protein